MSGPLPGAVHDLTAARIWGIITALAACGLVPLGYYDKKVAEGKTAKEALRALKRQVSDAIYKYLKERHHTARPQAASRVREGTRGTALSPARPDCTPNTGSSAKPLPDLPPPYDPAPPAGKGHITRRSASVPPACIVTKACVSRSTDAVMR